MEIALLSKKALRIKGKSATLLVDPSDLAAKTPADGVISFLSRSFDAKKVEGERVHINGVGEYEVGGIKISGFFAGDELAYRVRVDNVEVLLASGKQLVKLKEGNSEVHVLVVYTPEKIEEEGITAMEPKIAALYGEAALEVSTLLNKEREATGKLAVAADKLPEEMQTVLLASS